MSTTNNFFRPKRHFRSVFREGKFLLNTEATEIQLEIYDRLREQIKQVYGPAVSIKDGMLVEADTVIGRVIIRPGYSYVDGYPLHLQASTDPNFALGKSPTDFTSADFIKVAKTSTDVGGLALNFGGASPVAAGDYIIVLECKEDLITATQDPFLRSANLTESTADRHRLVVDVHILPKLTGGNPTLDHSPIPYRGTSVDNMVNYIEITPVGTTYGLVSANPISGAEAIDGRNLEIQINNGNGSSTAALPISNTDIREFIHGTLIDSNGIHFHISNMFVTPGNPTRLTLQLALAKNRPAQLTTYQDQPVLTDGVAYRLVKRDLFVTSASSLPEGKRFYPIAEVAWNGSTVTADDITDLRPLSLARDGVLDLIRNQGLTLHSEGLLFWDENDGGGKLLWEEPLLIHSVFEGFQWTIPADDTANLFGGLADNEVLYVNLYDKPTGGSLELKKALRGTGDLTPESLRASDMFWIAKKLVDGRVYFNGRLVLNNLQTGYFYDIPQDEPLAQDILTLGYQAMFEETLYDPSAFNPAASTASFFAASYLMAYDNQPITVSGNNITISNPTPFTLEVGDVVRQNDLYTLVTNVNSPTDFDVADGSILVTATNACICQKAETFNLRDLDDGGGIKERIATYLSSVVDKMLVTYDDDAIPQIGTSPRIGYSISADGGVTFSDVYVRPDALVDIVNEVYPSVTGTDVRIRFMPVVNTSNGTAVLDAFRAFFHSRNFVGTLLPSLGSGGGGGGGGGGGTSLAGPSLLNTQVFTMASYRAISITPSGPNYAQANDIDIANATIGILMASTAPGIALDLVTVGLAQGALTGLGFTAGDEVYLGLNGELIGEADVMLLPSGYVQKQLGFAVNSVDMWVQIADLEVIP